MRVRRPPSRLWWRVIVLVTLGFAVAMGVELFGLYTVIGWSDTLAHAGAGAAGGGLLALVGRRLTRYRTQHRVLSVLLVLQVAILWEGLEILLPGFAGYVELGAVDTAVDVIATTGGAVLAMLVVPGGSR